MVRRPRAPVLRSTAMSAIEKFVEMFKAAGGVMAERVTDLYDIRDRATARLQNLPEPGVPALDEPSILIAHDLAPAETATLDKNLVLGIVMGVAWFRDRKNIQDETGRRERLAELAGTQLDGGIAIGRGGALRDDLQAVQLQDGDGNLTAVLEEQTGHAQFLGDNTSTQHGRPLRP